MAGVTFDQVTKRFGDVVAVDDLTLEVADREFLVLLGPSGCGKSTALRMIAGLDDPTSGTIAIGGEVMNDIEPRDRDVAMVFQTYALYPHMTVRRNIEFPLKSRKVPADERERLVTEAAESLGLTDLLDRKPAQLSGGQRQRVALARAIVRRPQVFLMDEPLSNLDAKLRVQTRAELIELQSRLETTVVYVTHDQIEAMTMGDRIAIIAGGVAATGRTAARGVRATGQPVRRRVHRHPAHEHDRGARRARGRRPSRPGFPVRGFRCHRRSRTRSRRGRPSESSSASVPNTLLLATDGIVPATVTVIESLGHERNVVCRLDDGTFVITRQDIDDPRPAVGETVHLTTEPEHLHVFDARTGERVAEA